MSKHSTLIKPLAPNPTHSPIESILSLLPLRDIGPDIYTNARPLWHPPGARGIFGGAAIAQCLAAAQATITPDFTIHSMHCYFVLAGNSCIPILYHVERVRDGKSFVTRTVQARQRGKCIFTTTMSFARQGSGGRAPYLVEHQTAMAPDVGPAPPDGMPGWGVAAVGDSPFESVRCKVTPSGAPEGKRLRQWIRARGRISDKPVGLAYAKAPEPGTVVHKGQQQVVEAGEEVDNHQSHLSALAYMSDSYFIGTVARVHNLMRFANRRSIDHTVDSFHGSEEEKGAMRTYLEQIAKEEAEENADFEGAGRDTDGGGKKQIGMMVSLDHLIFFHNPRSFRADEWMLTEMESPWAGDGRGLVFQKIWTKEGVLIASCVQEGVVRLQQPKETKL